MNQRACGGNLLELRLGERQERELVAGQGNKPRRAIALAREGEGVHVLGKGRIQV
jgi:hypothetical protein